jgi:hypothetical protein
MEAKGGMLYENGIKNFQNINIRASEVLLQHGMKVIFELQSCLLYSLVPLGQDVIRVLFQSLVEFPNDFSLLEVCFFRIIKDLNTS